MYVCGVYAADALLTRLLVPPSTPCRCQGFANYLSSIINAVEIQVMNLVYTKLALAMVNWGQSTAAVTLTTTHSHPS
jgi:hypothetical protein